MTTTIIVEYETSCTQIHCVDQIHGNSMIKMRTWKKHAKIVDLLRLEFGDIPLCVVANQSRFEIRDFVTLESEVVNTYVRMLSILLCNLWRWLYLLFV